MKTKAKTIEECSALFEIEVSREDIDKAFNDIYDEMQRVASIPGFRVGKAPKELVKKHYARNAKEEVLKRLIPEAYRMAIEENSINPVGLPQITDVGLLEESKPLSFKARVETRPKFKLKNYKGIKIEKKKAVLKDDELDKTLENLRELNAKYVAVEDRPLELGDYAVSDLECFVENNPIHKKRENLWLYIDKESIAPGLHEKMVGMKKQDEKEIEIKLPDTYPDKAAAGKLAMYRVKVKEIKSRVLPKLDDEFAKDLSKENLEALRKEVGDELAKRMELNVEVDAENQLLKKLIDDNVFPVPQSLLARQLKYMIEDAKERLAQKGFKVEDLDKKDDEFKGRFKDEALRQVRLFFILNEIAALEKIEVGPEEIDQAYKAMSSQAGKGIEEVKTYYEKEGLTGDLEEKIRENKTIAFLMKAANIVEAAK